MFYWLLGGRAIGAREFQAPLPDNVAFFCATCGELWGRITSPERTLTRVVCVPCERHEPRYVADWSAIPGSMVTTYPEPYWNRAYTLENAPRSILQRELTLHLAHLDRSISYEQALEATPA